MAGQGICMHVSERHRWQRLKANANRRQQEAAVFGNQFIRCVNQQVTPATVNKQKHKLQTLELFTHHPLSAKHVHLPKMPTRFPLKCAKLLFLFYSCSNIR